VLAVGSSGKLPKGRDGRGTNIQNDFTIICIRMERDAVLLDGIGIGVLIERFSFFSVYTHCSQNCAICITALFGRARVEKINTQDFFCFALIL